MLNRTKYCQYRNFFIAFGLGYLVLILVLLLLAIGYFAGSYNTSVQEKQAMAALTWTRLHEQQNFTHPNQTLLEEPYPVCRIGWEDLHILDFGFFSLVAYEPDGKVLEADIDQYFNNTEFDFDVLHLSQTDMSSYYFHARDNSKNISIIGIRGTDSLRDALEDLDLWSEIAVLQGISFFVPLIHIWPSTTTSIVVKIANAVEPKIGPNYYEPISAYIKNNVTATDKIVLTGHSLGGGVANIVGALHDLPSFAFEPPGQVYNHVKFGYSLTATQKSTSIKSVGDPVTGIDKHGGNVQSINCKATSLFSCHSMTRAYCELAKRCFGAPCLYLDFNA